MVYYLVDKNIFSRTTLVHNTCVLRCKSNVIVFNVSYKKGVEKKEWKINENVKQGSDVGAFCDTIKCLSCRLET